MYMVAIKMVNLVYNTIFGLSPCSLIFVCGRERAREFVTRYYTAAEHFRLCRARCDEHLWTYYARLLLATREAYNKFWARCCRVRYIAFV